MSEIDPAIATVIDAIDAAVADPQTWPAALEQVAHYLGASFAALIYEDRASALLELKYSTSAQKKWLVEYLRSHRKLDAARAHVVEEVGVGLPFAAGDFLSPERFRQTTIYQRWMEPHGLIDILGAVLHRSNWGTCIFVAFKSAGAELADASSKERLLAVLPALMRAATLGGRDVKTALPDSQLTQLFDQLLAPIIVVDNQMRIKRCNKSGWELLNSHPTLSSSNGVLLISDAAAREALVKALRREKPLGAKSCVIMLRRGGERCCVMHVLLLSHGEAAVLVRRLESHADNSGEVIADLYGLTARERSVLFAITDVGGVPATARALGLTESTVKSYLKSIFQKTGAQRQADLVKLVIALEPPFIAPMLEGCLNS